MSYHVRYKGLGALGLTASGASSLLTSPIKTTLTRAGTTISASAASSLLSTASSRHDDGPGTNGTFTNPDGSITSYHVNTDGSLTILATYGGPSAGGGAPPPLPDPSLPPPPVSTSSAAVASSGGFPTVLLIGAAAIGIFLLTRKK